MIYELVKGGLELLADLVGLHGLKIGALAVALVALYYLRELSELLRLGARGLRTVAIVGAALLAVLVAGLYLGVLSLDAGLGVVVETLTELLKGVLH